MYISAAVTVQLTESDYRAVENQESIPVQLSMNRRIATPLTLRIVPRNVTEVLDSRLLSMMLPSDFPPISPLNRFQPNRATSELTYYSMNFGCQS